MLYRRIISLSALLAASLALTVGDVFAFSGRGADDRVEISSWKFSASDDPSFSTPDYDDASWEPVSFPSSLKLGKEAGWLRAEIRMDPPTPGEPLYLFLGRLDSAAQVYFNGSLLGIRGTFPPDYSTPANEPGVFPVPVGLWKRDGGNVIAVRLKAPSSSIQVEKIGIGGEQVKQYEDRIVAFFNFRLYTILGALCAFIGLYFLALWLGRRKDTPNLWYAISSWAIAFYFAEMGSSFPLFGYSVNRALAKTCLIVSMAALTAFFIDYFKMKRPRFVVVSLAVIPMAFLAAFLIVRQDNTLISTVFNASLLFVQAAILFIVFVTIRAVVRGNREAVILLVGVVVGVGLGTHDVVYAAMGAKPFAWLQGLGFFSMNISLFVTLTLRSSRLYKELESYSADIGEKSRQLSTYIDRIEKTANSVSAITTEIDEDAGIAEASAVKLASEAERIGSNADRQAQAAADSEESVKSLSSSLGQVRAGVDTQAAGIEESVESVAIVSEAAAKVTENVESTETFARGLDGTAEKGREASRGLAEAIRRIKDSAGEIVSIVATVEDFAERTNLLSMNAAIEAAHAGSAGRGFAVIATEIKGLAAASAERSAAIRSSIADIIGRIENGVQANAGVTEALDSVAEGAKVALQGIRTVGASLEAQRAATEKLSAALQTLSASASSIREEAERQEADGERIRSRMAELVTISNDLRSSIAGIARENASIADTMRRLASVSRDGKEAVAGLRLVLDSRKAG